MRASMTIIELRDRIAEIVKIADPRWLTAADVFGQIPDETHARIGSNMYQMGRLGDRIILNPAWYSNRMGDKTYGLR
jgi:hypothetical protein